MLMVYCMLGSDGTLDGACHSLGALDDAFDSVKVAGGAALSIDELAVERTVAVMRDRIGLFVGCDWFAGITGAKGASTV